MVGFSLNDGIATASFFIELAEIIWVLLTVGAVGRIVSSLYNDLTGRKAGGG